MKSDTEPRQGLVPLHEPVFAGNEWAYVKDCLDTAWVSSAGAYVDRFERMTAERLDVRRAVAVVNGTAALHLALQAAGVGKDDEVLCPTLTFIATANAASYLGARPRFVDAEPESFGMDPDGLEAWLARRAEPAGGGARHRESGRRVAACVLTHVFGLPARVGRIQDICARWGIALVEDAAEALGSSVDGRAAGTFGAAGVLSFNGNKVLTTGGGGMVVTDDESLAERVRHLSTQAKKDSAAYLHDEVGYNYRMPNINAALGCAQMEQLDGFLAKKRAVAEWYRDGLADSPLRLAWESAGARSNFWLNAVQAPSEDAALALMSRLREAGFECRPIWTPAHRQPFVAQPQEELPQADRLWKTVINLPSSATVTKGQALAICRVLRSLP